MDADAMYVMTPGEIVEGYLSGLQPSAATRDTRASCITATPREALERIVLESVRRPPCGVAFSGGRDSSLVLAVATAVARREGFPDPIPLTRLFPSEPRAQESEWQELVVRHLGLEQWCRLEFEDELDLVGPLAQRHLREFGVVWPPTFHVSIPLLEQVRGGSLLDGEGGDEVLGANAHRVAPIGRLWRSKQPLPLRRVGAAARAVAPARIRFWHQSRRWADRQMPWLKPPARRSVASAMLAAEREQHLSFRQAVRDVPRRRSQVVRAHNLQLQSAGYDVATGSPLLVPAFVTALAAESSWLGPGNRTKVLRGLASDLLPDAVLTRTSKATFTGAYLSRYSREFAASWDGFGVNHDLVDWTVLRAIWSSERGNALSSTLLQSAWRAVGHDDHGG